MEKLNQLFAQHFGTQPAKTEKLAGAGSNRIYYRLSNGKQTAIGVQGESIAENRAFVALARHFETQCLPTPKVFATSSDEKYYLQEDLGDTSLFQAVENGIKTGIFSEKEKNLLFRTIELLPCLQFDGARGLDFSVCYPQPEFNRDTVMWDLNYFKYCFLKPSGAAFFEPDLEKDFQALAADLTTETGNTFLYRDFQARNVMIKNGHPYFIDFQGGRRGAVHYDVASFVWQAKANYPQQLREELIERYLQVLEVYDSKLDKTQFKERLKLFVFFRNLQVLGAYGYRGYFERKPHFIESIPFAINNLRGILENNFPYPHLCEVLKELCDLPQFRGEQLTGNGERETANENDSLPLTVNRSPLTVPPLLITINSFSYKRGIPDDLSGNGGGYVFDCRGMNNPGRYDEYKTLTGLDKPVIVFLEREGEITEYLKNIYPLAERHIENYLQRGFSNLMFSFGCTGGQHRSVYAAQHLAEFLHKKYGLKITLKHREQGIYKEYNQNTKHTDNTD